MRNFIAFIVLLASLVGLTACSQYEITNNADFFVGCATMTVAHLILFVSWVLLKD